MSRSEANNRKRRDTSPPFHAKGAIGFGSRRSPGLRQEFQFLFQFQRLQTRTVFPCLHSDGPFREPATSDQQLATGSPSLTVARQRGTCTRFPYTRTRTQ